MSVTFQKESWEVLKSQAEKLFKEHYLEIAHYQDIELALDHDLYLAIEKNGGLRVFTARIDGKVQGYAVFFVKTNLHYKNSIQAVQDIIFISKERRGFGRNFIAWCDEELKKEGVQVVYHHVKEAHNFGPMLERMGYQKIDAVYGRRLDREV